ncbi:predicted protein [Nematostella vectensis]|uniref:Pentraxin (PTX) domain-containing protein n=1 Tax=Nematostella vectensis TaxID=45351 RepID=A7T5K9_NEMVE|nr:predicted protein [Nematostella vectensis]|eukprot:XP_001620851.1 hypothetical protein NEMVEDRAFT_v1g222646 [Nematostella vectensis]
MVSTRLLFLAFLFAFFPYLKYILTQGINKEIQDIFHIGSAFSITKYQAIFQVSLGKQVLEFPEPNSTNRLECFNEKPRQIYNISVCLWFQSSKQSTESSTVFSLATKKSDDAFTVFLYRKHGRIALYLQTGKPVSSIDDDVFDSHWHHYCASWTDSTNAWKTYLNGTLKGHGEEALSMEDSLQCPLHDVSIVLGADQDGYQSKFKEPFLGNMTAVNIWNRELTDTEIADLAKECPSGIGNFLSWEGFLMKFSDKTRMICPVECEMEDESIDSFSKEFISDKNMVKYYFQHLKTLSFKRKRGKGDS